jgi:hypothetical protein
VAVHAHSRVVTTVVVTCAPAAPTEGGRPLSEVSHRGEAGPPSSVEVAPSPAASRAEERQRSRVARSMVVS